MKYLADDGTIFDVISECIAYERDNAIKDYYDKWVDQSLNVRAEKVIQLFQDECRKHRWNDNHLISEGHEPRYENNSYTVSVDTGIVNLRDDLVDILIARIRELENTYEPQ